MNNQEPHISVIIPAHNEERYVGWCIDSIRKAAFGDTKGMDKLLDELFYDYNDKH